MTSWGQKKIGVAYRLVRGCSAILAAFAADEAAQDVVDYGLLIASIVVVVLVGTVAFGQQIEPWFRGLAGRITTTGT
jgi:Flp pilus assembly pilin Flp